MASKRPFETVCKDFGTRKGCGQKILMKPTNEMKEDGSGPKWKAYELEGTELHTHDANKPATVANPQARLTGSGPVSNPQAVTSNTVLEKQIAQLAQEFEGLRMRVNTLEERIIQNEANALTNASENELGEEPAE